MVDVVVFDLGNVLIPWDRRFLYEKVIREIERQCNGTAMPASPRNQLCGKSWASSFEPVRSAARKPANFSVQHSR